MTYYVQEGCHLCTGRATRNQLLQADGDPSPKAATARTDAVINNTQYCVSGEGWSDKYVMGVIKGILP